MESAVVAIVVIVAIVAVAAYAQLSLTGGGGEDVLAPLAESVASASARVVERFLSWNCSDPSAELRDLSLALSRRYAGMAFAFQLETVDAETGLSAWSEIKGALVSDEMIDKSASATAVAIPESNDTVYLVFAPESSVMVRGESYDFVVVVARPGGVPLTDGTVQLHIRGAWSADLTMSQNPWPFYTLNLLVPTDGSAALGTIWMTVEYNGPEGTFTNTYRGYITDVNFELAVSANATRAKAGHRIRFDGTSNNANPVGWTLVSPVGEVVSDTGLVSDFVIQVSPDTLPPGFAVLNQTGLVAVEGGNTVNCFSSSLVWVDLYYVIVRARVEELKSFAAVTSP